MSKQLQDLIRRAGEAREKAHAPYSGFKVGAVIRSAEGGVFAGCNVENASYPQGWCAETSAIAAMIGAGHHAVAEVVVTGGGTRLCTPCGGCRQKLAEFAGPETPVHVCGPEGLRRSFTLGELMPHAFDRDSLD